MTARTRTSSPTARVLAIAGGLLLLAAGAVIWFLAGDAPEAVDIDQAAGARATGQTAADATTSTSPDGTWQVDTTIGEFSVTETTGTFVGFRIEEELANVGATEAIGRTPNVSGTVVLDGSILQEATITADLTDILSDEPRRDDRIQDALETEDFPEATFDLDGPIQLDNPPRQGEQFTVDAPGSLTIHGVTRELTVPPAGRLDRRRPRRSHRVDAGRPLRLRRRRSDRSDGPLRR